MIEMTAQDLVIYDGDSLTEGLHVEPSRNRPSMTTPLLARPVKSMNMGVSGEAIVSRLAQFEKNIAANYVPEAKNNIISLLIGTNDLVAYNRPIEPTLEGVKEYCSKAKALGFKIALGTLLPHGVHPNRTPTAGQYANMETLNNHIRQSVGRFSDAVIDYANHPLMGPKSSVTDKTLYIDEVHPTALGYYHLATLEAVILNHLLI